MTGSPIAQLVSAAQQGDPVAADALFTRAAKLAYARALKLTSSPDSAWDIAQDALVSAIGGLPALRQPGAFLGWLRSIVDHAALAYRARPSYQRERPLSAAGNLCSPEPSPADLAERRAVAAQVRRAMAALSPRDRVIVELFYFEEMSCREVADFLKTTRDAVKMALHRSRLQMRKEIRTMASTAGSRSAERRIGRTMSGGDSSPARSDLLFDHDSPAARFYARLYPVGNATQVARALGLTDKQRDAELSWLQARKFIVSKGDLWRCTMPIMDAKDMEIMRPWATAVTESVTTALDELHHRLSALAEQADPPGHTDTVLAAGLYAEVARRPFNAITAAMNPSVTDRGEFGRRSVAAVTAETDWPKDYRGGIDIGESTSDEFPGVRRDYFLRPAGTDRSALAGLARSVGEDISGTVAGRGLFGFLCSLGCDPPDVAAVGDRAASFGLDVSDPGSFVSELERLQAIATHNDQIKLIIPAVPQAAWQPFLDELDRIGERILGAVADAAEDLRARMLRCSFAECDFGDSVALCVGLAEALVAEAIRTRDWVTFPAAADFSWGVMFTW